MNESVKRLLFGNQKQSLRQNEAISHFVEEYIGAGSVTDLVELRQMVMNNVAKAVEKFDAGEGVGLADKLFIEYIVGSDGLAAVQEHVPCSIKWKPVGDNGKVMFYLEPAGNVEGTAALNLSAQASKYESKESKKAASREDEAWELVRKMLSSIAPSMREELPTDDALAAIMVSKEYWRVHG